MAEVEFVILIEALRAVLHLANHAEDIFLVEVVSIIIIKGHLRFESCQPDASALQHEAILQQ